jgi:hypothetical protein
MDQFENEKISKVKEIESQIENTKEKAFIAT